MGPVADTLADKRLEKKGTVMTNPPQQPWNQGGNTGPQHPQQWGGQGAGQPSQQWGGQQNPQGGASQWGAPAQPYGPQGGQQWNGAAPKKSNAKLWIGLGVGAALLLVLIVVLVLVLGGGGKYAGKERPDLPDDFGGWSKGDRSDVYKKGPKVLMVSEQDIEEDEQDLKKAMEDSGEDVDLEDVEIEKPSKGVECATTEVQGMEVTVCAIFYEDEKGFVVAGMPGEFFGGEQPTEKEVHDAAVALSKVD